MGDVVFGAGVIVVAVVNGVVINEAALM